MKMCAPDRIFGRTPRYVMDIIPLALLIGFIGSPAERRSRIGDCEPVDRVSAGWDRVREITD